MLVALLDLLVIVVSLAVAFELDRRHRRPSHKVSAESRNTKF